MTTTKVYLIRCVLDTSEDVIRDIVLLPNSDLNLLQRAILNAFELEQGEMSSYFRSSEDWEQGAEISMMDFDPATGRNALDNENVGGCFREIGSRMLYVYDFLRLWTFYLELVAILEPDMDKTYPRLVGKVGERPEEPPVKTMKVDKDPYDSLLEEEEKEEDFDSMDEDQWY